MSATVVLGDVHLTTRTPRVVGEDLARLLAMYPGASVVSCGDLFDHSADRPNDPPAEAVRAALEAHPAARRALSEHLDRGGRLLLLAGNHDAAITGPGFRASLGGALELSAEATARIEVAPWFVRRGGLHLEHGHAYDDDNAPEHPLVDGEPSLGVHFVRSFIAPTGAFAYLNTNDDTPWRLFSAAFRWYGPRAPYVVYRYFHAAFEAMARSGPLYRAGAERARGDARMDAFAAEAGISRDLAERVLAQIAPSTLRSAGATVSRLYFDRVVATVSTAVGLSALAWPGGRSRRGAAALAALGLGWLVATWWVRFDRFGGTVPERLRAGALRVRESTGADLVILGHAHREALEPGYANTGSFAFPAGSPGRPYLLVDADGARPEATRRYLLAG